MAISLHEKLAALPAERRARVEARAAELIAEELSLRELRKAFRKTQSDIAKELRIGQEGISRIEQRGDLMLSTLRGYIEAMGGELHVVATFPERPPVRLSFASNKKPRRKKIA